MFTPKRVLFEKNAMDYQLAKNLYKQFIEIGIDVEILKSNRVTGIQGNTSKEKFIAGKSTLVIGVRKTLKFQTCKPSAHYQLPLVTGCMGQCEYCYLNTQLGDKPYIRAYVNKDDIFHQAEKYIGERLPEKTIFEGAAVSDPMVVEDYTHGIRDAIEFFSTQTNAAFRFVTKYDNVNSLLNINHNNMTTIRFSINTDEVIRKYEHMTPRLNRRIEASKKIIEAGYPTGFIIAPVFLDEGWQEKYKEMFENVSKVLNDYNNIPIDFEVISHRFTQRAKNRILSVFEESSLPMNEEERKFKYGQFGYGKYVYPKEKLNQMKEFFQQEIEKYFIKAQIKYII